MDGINLPLDPEDSPGTQEHFDLQQQRLARRREGLLASYEAELDRAFLRKPSH